jgi:hypothetical protein
MRCLEGKQPSCLYNLALVLKPLHLDHGLAHAHAHDLHLNHGPDHHLHLHHHLDHHLDQQQM